MNPYGRQQVLERNSFGKKRKKSIEIASHGPGHGYGTDMYGCGNPQPEAIEHTQTCLQPGPGPALCTVCSHGTMEGCSPGTVAVLKAAGEAEQSAINLLVGRSMIACECTCQPDGLELRDTEQQRKGCHMPCFRSSTEFSQPLSGKTASKAPLTLSP